MAKLGEYFLLQCDCVVVFFFVVLLLCSAVFSDVLELEYSASCIVVTR